MTVWSYRAHGLAVVANRPIVDLLEDAHATHPDVTILFGEQPPVDPAAPESTWFASIHTTASGEPALVATRGADRRLFRIAYADGPSFVLDASGSTVWVSWPAALTMADTLSYLLGPIVGIVMRLRGIACLHASAVELNGRAHVFAGPEGAGKSTLAAAFARGGERVLSDDIVTVTRHRSEFLTAPGYPRVRLWPDAMGALPADVPALGDGARAAAGRHHLDLRAGDRFARRSQPIAAIYFLEYAECAIQPRIEPVTPVDALPLLAASTFAGRVLDREGRIAEFEMVTDLAASVPMRRLVRAPGLNRIASVCAAVVDACSPCEPAATPRS